MTGDPNDRFPVWSPSGRSVAFVHPVRGGVRLAVIASTGRGQRVLRLGPPPTGRPSWTPDGKSLVIAVKGSFFRVSASTGKVQRQLGPTYDVRDGEPWWTLAPNGRTIALVARGSEPAGCGGLECDVFALYLAPVSSKQTRRLVDDGGFAGWTPDSRRVVYSTGSGLVVKPVGAGASRTISVGSAIRPLGDSPPAWQP